VAWVTTTPCPAIDDTTDEGQCKATNSARQLSFIPPTTYFSNWFKILESETPHPHEKRRSHQSIPETVTPTQIETVIPAESNTVTVPGVPREILGEILDYFVIFKITTTQTSRFEFAVSLHEVLTVSTTLSHSLDHGEDTSANG